MKVKKETLKMIENRKKSKRRHSIVKHKDEEKMQFQIKTNF